MKDRTNVIFVRKHSVAKIIFEIISKYDHFYSRIIYSPVVLWWSSLYPLNHSIIIPDHLISGPLGLLEKEIITNYFILRKHYEFTVQFSTIFSIHFIWMLSRFCFNYFSWNTWVVLLQTESHWFFHCVWHVWDHTFIC